MTGTAGGGVGGFQKFDGIRWIGFNNENYGLGYPFPFLQITQKLFTIVLQMEI